MSRAMKDSEIPWIGEISKTWQVMPYKRIMHKEKELLEKYNGEDVLSLTMRGVIVRDLDGGGKMPSSFDGYQKVYSGEILQCLFDIDVTPRCVGLIKNDGITSPAYSRFVVHSNAYAAYYNHQLRYMDDNKVLLHLSKNIRSSLKEDDFGVVNTCVPPLIEQQRIAEFLDRKCGEIDETIALQEEFIEELKAYKQSVITEAVTRGLNPNVKFKDSGVDWIGKIPQRWKCEKVKHIISSITSGVSVNAEQIPATDEDLGVLKTSSVSSNYFIPTENKKVDVEEMGRVSCPVKADTIIVSRMNTPDLVGSAGYCKDNIPNLYLPDRLWQVETIKDRVSAKYLWRFLISLSARYYYSSLSQGTSSSMQNISQSQFESAFVPVPPLTEQKQIADFLDNKCTEIDSLIAVKLQKIEELKDYKKSVIYEYVTGKKEVNG